MNDTTTEEKKKLDLAEILRALIVQTGDPSRVLEWYYWAQEPGILEFVRSLLMLPPEARRALQTFMASAEDPVSVSVSIDDNGTLNLFSPNAAKTMKTFFAEGRTGPHASRSPS